MIAISTHTFANSIFPYNCVLFVHVVSDAVLKTGSLPPTHPPLSPSTPLSQMYTLWPYMGSHALDTALAYLSHMNVQCPEMTSISFNSYNSILIIVNKIVHCNYQVKK